MNIELLQQLCEASAVSGDEQEVRDILINTLEPCVNEITFDGLGSFVARKGNKGPKVSVVGHMVAKRWKSAAWKLVILLARKPILPAGAKIKWSARRWITASAAQ